MILIRCELRQVYACLTRSCFGPQALYNACDRRAKANSEFLCFKQKYRFASDRPMSIVFSLYCPD